jgi:hypothetical protein
MSSDNDALALSAGSDSGVHENSTAQDSMVTCSDRLVLSDGSHMGSISADAIDPDSIGDPLVDVFVDQPQQEREGWGAQFGCRNGDFGL